MRKLLFCGAILALTFTSCENDQSTNNLPEASVEVDMSDFYVYTDDTESKSTEDSKHGDKCHSMQVLNRQLRENPGLEKKMYDIELNTRKAIAAKKPAGTPGGGGNGGGDPEPPAGYTGTVTIPVIVHVVQGVGVESVSDTQITNQMIVLNADFNDETYGNIPSEFQGVAANTDITFTLSSSNIKRHTSTTTDWGTNNAVKAAYPPITPETHLNIWVCNMGGGILGYAQFPGGNPLTDGVVILPGTLPGGSAAPYNGGRTLTHEVGHYLNLRHIWGDGRCRQDDFVSDTPSSDGPNYGCPGVNTVITNCKSRDMHMNYMDYTDDACMNMFTDGQNDRMRAIFDTNGVRISN